MPDTFAPATGERMDADGRVSYQFEGQVKARGLELDASTGAPTDDERVRWLRGDDTAAAAISSHKDGRLLLLARKQGPPVNEALLSIDADNSLFPAAITAQLQGAPPRVLLNSLGKSDFLQLAAQEKVHLRGPYSVPVPALAAGAWTAGFTFVTNLPNTPGVQWAVLGHIFDGGTNWSAFVNWGWQFAGANALVMFANPFGFAVPVGVATWRGIVITFEP